MLLRRIARPLFATWFVTQGFDAVRNPAAHAEDARATIDLLTGLLPDDACVGTVERCRTVTSRQAASLVQAHGAVTLAVGALLALGKAPRIAALVLAGLTVPLAIANLPFTDRPGVDKDERRERRDRFVRAVSFAGGALLAAADYEGRPGVAWRVRRARREHAAPQH